MGFSHIRGSADGKKKIRFPPDAKTLTKSKNKRRQKRMRSKRMLMIALACAMLAGCGKADTKETNASGYPGMSGIAVSDTDLDYTQCVKLGTYEGLKLTKRDASPDESLVEAYAKTLAGFEESFSGAASNGDRIRISFKGTHNGEEFEGGSYEGYELVLGSGGMVEGFEDEIIGMTPGEEKDITVTFPENYSVFPGEDVDFHITLHSILLQKEATEENVADARKELEESGQAAAETELKQLAWGQVFEEAKISRLPQELLSFYEEYYEEQTVSYMGSVEAYMEKAGVSQEEYDNAKKSYASENARYTIVVEALWSEMGMSEESDTYKAAKEEHLTNLGLTEEEAYKEYGERFMKLALKYDAVAAELVNRAEIENAGQEE